MRAIERFEPHHWHRLEHGLWAVHPSDDVLAKALAAWEATQRLAEATVPIEHRQNGGPGDNDVRWYGTLAEMGLRSFLRRRGVAFIADGYGGLDGKPDVVIAGRTTEVKTRTMDRARFRHDYNVAVPDDCRHKTVHLYAFPVYERAFNRLIIAGFMARTVWWRVARKPTGADAKVRDKHACHVLTAAEICSADTFVGMILAGARGLPATTNASTNP